MALADASTAPGQQWTVGTRTFNPQGTLIFHTSHATSTSSIAAQFTIPSSDYGFTDYLYTSPNSLPSLSTTESITALITITGSAFEAGPWGSQSASAPAVIYLFIQANTPTAEQYQTPPSCGLPPGYSMNNYWWAAATTITDSAGTLLTGPFTLTASLSGTGWTGICGQSAPTDGSFATILASATDVGLAFGGGYPSQFGANGIATTAGSATFQLNSFTIS